MRKSIFESFPAVYREILPSFFETFLHNEKTADCGNCVMLGETETGCEAAVYFSGNTRCCTYYPELPNYMLGAVLSDRSPSLREGRRRIRSLIRKKIAVTPKGLFRPKKYILLTQNSNQEYFGRSEELLCPFFVKNNSTCSLNPCLDAVCFTYFCKHDLGADGMNFWQAMWNYLHGLEKLLSSYVLLSRGFRLSTPGLTPDYKSKLSLQDLDRLPLLNTEYEVLWGEWRGKEEEFFIEAFRIVSSLNREDLDAIEGVVQKGLLKDVETYYKAMFDPAIPDRLKIKRGIEVVKLPDGRYLLSSYSAIDPLKVSRGLYRCLDYFDGTRPNSDVCRIIKEETGIELPWHILGKLYRFRVLVPT